MVEPHASSRRNLSLSPNQVTSALLAQKQDARAAIRSHIGEIRLPRWRMAGLTVSAFGRAMRNIGVIHRADIKID